MNTLGLHRLCSLSTKHYIPLSDRQRDVAEVLGSLDQIDLKQPVEFSAEEKQQQEQQPEPAAMRKFVMRPLLDVERNDQLLNQLVVSDNRKNNSALKKDSVSLQSNATLRTPHRSKFPVLKMFKLRPLEKTSYTSSTEKPKNHILAKRDTSALLHVTNTMKTGKIVDSSSPMLSHETDLPTRMDVRHKSKLLHRRHESRFSKVGVEKKNENGKLVDDSKLKRNHKSSKVELGKISERMNVNLMSNSRQDSPAALDGNSDAVHPKPNVPHTNLGVLDSKNFLQVKPSAAEVQPKKSL